MILLRDELLTALGLNTTFISAELQVTPGQTVTVTPPAGHFVDFTWLSGSSDITPTTFTVTRKPAAGDVVFSFVSSELNPIVGVNPNGSNRQAQTKIVSMDPVVITVPGSQTTNVVYRYYFAKHA